MFRTILIDPPWAQQMLGTLSKARNKRPAQLPYPTMSLEEIAALPVESLADGNAHLWLWTTNQFLEPSFALMRGWGFKPMVPVHWIKPSGCGMWWIHRSQTLLFGYKGRLDMRTKLHPNVLFAPSRRHSQKPEAAYELIEQVSHGPRVELFARATRPGWHSIGNEIDGKDIRQLTANPCEWASEGANAT